MPPNSPTLEAAIARWKEFHERLEARVLEHIDELAGSGFADKRWCAIARTDFEKAMLALDKALPKDMAGRRDYAKHPLPDGAFVADPPRDAEPERNVGGTLNLRRPDDSPDVA